MEEFLQGNLLVRLTDNDFNLLSELEKQSGLHWASGDKIDSKLTVGYIIGHQNNLIICVGNSCMSTERVLWMADPNDHEGCPIVDLVDILDCSVGFTIEEEDVLNLIAE